MTKARRPRSIAPYRDVEAILDTILAHDQYPGIVRLGTPKDAFQWRHRANILRSIQREQEEVHQGLPPGTGSSRFDNFHFALNGNVVEVTLKDGKAVVEPITESVTVTFPSQEPDDDNAID